MKPGAQAQNPLAPIQQHLDYLTEQLLLTKQRVAALEAEALLRDEGRKPAYPVEFRSQFGEDLWIWDVLGRPTSGFFIEAGAFDGYHFSATYGLEATGWTGLLVEALPGRFEQCKSRRPRSRVVHSALVRRNAPASVKFVDVQDQYGGMLSYVQAPTEHSRDIEKSKLRTSTIEVPATTLNELLKDHTGPIDAAVIDVEGAELHVLDGFDLHRFKPRVLLLEENSRGRDQALAQYMATQPYVSAGWVGVNMAFVRADQEALLERLRRY